MKTRKMVMVAMTIFLLAMLTIHAKADSSAIASKGIFQSSDGSVVFDSRDFNELENAFEIGKRESYELGYQVGLEEGKSSASLKDIVANYSNISVSNVSYGSGTHTLPECLLYVHGSGGNWTDAYGGRVADITLTQYLVDPDGNVLAYYCNGTYAGDYFRGHSSPYQLTYVPDGSKMVVSYKVAHDNGASSSVWGTMIRIY